MSTGGLNQTFQEFLHTIHNWSRPTIEKDVLIQMLEELCRKNPELQNIYDDVSTLTVAHQFSNDDVDNYSRLDPSEIHANQSGVQNVVKHSDHNNHQLMTNKNHIAKNESNLLPNIPPINILVKAGDLTIRKGSTILSPLLKKQRLRTTVRCELACAYCDHQKVISFIVYESRKSRKILHKFIIDDTCSWVYENKRNFQLKHASAVENFTTETGTADTWISFYNEVLVRPDTDVDEFYENPESFPSIPTVPYSEHMFDTPERPPPRPPQPTNSILPENIYICLYDHNSTNEDSYELEFSRGDLLYIMNTDGSNFYVARRLILPFNNHVQNPIGLVFKDYIRPAYEQVC